MRYLKDPDTQWELTIHWRRWLHGRTLSGVAYDLVKVSGDGVSPLVVAAQSIVGTDSIVKLSGGALGDVWELTAHGEADDGGTEDQTFTITVRKK